MANAADNQACSSFAAIFAKLLADALNKGSAGWQVGLADPPPVNLPVLDSPVLYCLRFGERLHGNCYVVFAQADVALFGSREQPAAKDADMVADASQLVEAPAETLLAFMRSLAAAMPQALAATHGAVTVVAEQVNLPDLKAAYALELKASDGKGGTASILLHFDPDMQASLAAAAPSAPATPPIDKGMVQSMVQGNLGLVMDVELNCTLRFGQRQLSLREILDLASGSVVELDRQVDEPVELILDGKVIARGEAVIIDGNYGLRVTQVLHNVGF